jgi:hypothetical protein
MGPVGTNSSSSCIANGKSLGTADNTISGRAGAHPFRPLIPVLPVFRAVPALLGILPRLDFAARIQVLVNSIPARVFLSVVVARCQQKTERRDEDASQSEHRGNGLKGRGIIYLKRIHRARVGTVFGSPFAVRSSRFAASPISPIV